MEKFKWANGIINSSQHGSPFRRDSDVGGVERREERRGRAGGPANFVFDLLSKNMSCFAAAAEQRVNEGRKTPSSVEEEIELFATTAVAPPPMPPFSSQDTGENSRLG